MVVQKKFPERVEQEVFEAEADRITSYNVCYTKLLRIGLVEKRPGFEAEGSELRFRLGRLRQDRLGDTAGALTAYREVLGRVARHPGTLQALEEIARTSGPAAGEAASILEST